MGFDITQLKSLGMIPCAYHRYYYLEADMSRYLAIIIDTLNLNDSTGNVISPTERIKTLVEEYYRINNK